MDAKLAFGTIDCPPLAGALFCVQEAGYPALHLKCRSLRISLLTATGLNTKNRSAGAQSRPLAFVRMCL